VFQASLGDRPALAVTTSFAVKNWHRPATITCLDLVLSPRQWSCQSFLPRKHIHRATHTATTSRNNQPCLAAATPTVSPSPYISLTGLPTVAPKTSYAQPQPSSCSWKPQVVAGNARRGYHAGTLLCDAPLESPRTCLGLEVRCIIASLLPVLSRSMYPNPLSAQCLVS
jgi:hypothetical protein